MTNEIRQTTPPLFTASTRTLQRLAAILWYTGGIVLLFKAISLMGQAADIRSDTGWLIAVVIGGLAIGSLKVRFIFIRACRKNLARIAALDQPRLWQFYRTGFFVFLAAMILLGRYLSESAHGHYGGLLAVATLDLSLATALLGSSFVFWQKPSAA